GPRDRRHAEQSGAGPDRGWAAARGSRHAENGDAAPAALRGPAASQGAGPKSRRPFRVAESGASGSCRPAPLSPEEHAAAIGIALEQLLPLAFLEIDRLLTSLDRHPAGPRQIARDMPLTVGPG